LTTAYQGGAPSQPKTLFQKTKSETTRLRSSMFTARILPPPKRQRMPHSSSSLTGPGPGPSKSTKSLVTVRTVTYKRPSIAHAPPQSSGQPPNPSGPASPAPVTPQKSAASACAPNSSQTTQSPPSKEQRPFKSPINKKDPMTSLFMPKHRTLSQLPAQTSNPRIMPTR
jgi:elongin-A